MKRFQRILAGLGVPAVATLTVLPLLWPLFPLATIFAPMAPQCAGLGLLLAVTAIFAGCRKLAVLSLIVAVWNAQVVWPDVSPFREATAAGGHPVIKLVNYNLRFKNERLDAVADYLTASGADIVGLVEATPRAKAALERLKSAYPYRLDCIGSVPKCQNMLFSKYPLRNAYAGPIDGRFPTIAIAEVEMPGGTLVTVGVVHLMTPFVGPRPPLAAVDPAQPAPRFADAPDLEQSHQAANLAAFLQRQSPDLVLIGDFNSAPWSPLQQAFRAATGLDDRGHFLTTWPTSVWPMFRLSLDQVFVRGRARVTEIRLGPDVGSDHFPVEADIAITR